MSELESSAPGLLRPLRLAAGTRRAPKLDAVRAVARELLPTLSGGTHDGFELWSGAVDPGVAETPLDLEALVEGARTRARKAMEAARAEHFEAHFGLGLEGGVFSGFGGRLFLQSWACVTDGARVVLGAGPALPLPESLAVRLRAGESLAAAMDTLTARADVRSREGAFGVFTRGRLDRRAIFESALVCAFAEFDLPEYYGS